MMWDNGDGWRMHDQGAGWVMVLLMLVVVIAVVVAVIAILRGTVPLSPATHSASGTRGTAPRVILQERFARGEITAAELQQIRDDLSGGS